MIEKVQESHLYMWLKEKDSKFLSKLDETIEYANTILPQINNVFASYTVHGVRHSINVMEYMYALVVDINKLSELEVALLIYSALLHDIGMIANVDEIKEIKADHAILGERKYSKVLEKYGDEMTALQECVRPVHGKRARDYIETKMDERLFLIPESTNISFKSELAQICMSHNEDFEWIKKNLHNDEKKGHFDLNAQYISVLLRISDYLDIDEQRAPLYLYKYLNPKEFSDLEWKQHFVIENYDKIRRNPKTNELEIFFQGTSQDPSVHRKLLKYFDAINGELKNAVDLCESFVDEKYLLPLKTNVVNQIQSKGFSFSDLRLSLDYNAVTNLLMGEHIYGDRKYGLRELIQNSIDACKTNGTAYAGKSTMVKLLAEKYDGIACEENYQDRLLENLDTKEFPNLTYTRDLQDWGEFVRRTPDEYEAWVNGVTKECTVLEIEILKDLVSRTKKKIFVDTNISVEILHEISDENHVLIMLADPNISVQRFFERPDKEKQFLYQLLLKEDNPEDAMINFRECLKRVNSQERYMMFQKSGFNVITRDENRSIDETFALAESMFGLNR